MNVKLLRKVAAHILEEPRRLYMEQWCIRSSEAPCGTGACIAGWTAILGGKAEKSAGGWFADWEKDAKDLLRLSNEKANRLFRFPNHCDSKELKNREHWPTQFLRPYRQARKTETRAKIAAARIEHFIKTKGRE